MAKSKSQPTIRNRQAMKDYKLVDKYTAGIVLTGPEVKSLRTGNADLKGSYISVNRGELWLINAFIAPYTYSKADDSYDPNQTRKLLLSKSEVAKLVAAKQNKLSIIPTMFITNSKFIKLEIATAKGLKKHDKRDKIKAKIDVREARSSKN